MIFLITFDLRNADKKYYDLAYKILALYGLYRKLPDKDISFPSTTVLGEFSDDETTLSKLISSIWKSFEDKRLNPSKIFGGEIDNWCMKY